MVDRGNMLAVQFKAEIEILEDICGRLRTIWGAQDHCQSLSSEVRATTRNDDSESLMLDTSALDPLDIREESSKAAEGDGELRMVDFVWQEGYATEQFLTFADSIDLSYLDSLQLSSFCLLYSLC